MTLSVVTGRVLDSKGKRSVRTTDNEWSSLSRNIQREAPTRFPRRRHVHSSAGESMDGRSHDAGVDWEPATVGERALLVLDSLRAHITQAVKRKLREINTVPVVIPGGVLARCNP